MDLGSELEESWKVTETSTTLGLNELIGRTPGQVCCLLRDAESLLAPPTGSEDLGGALDSSAPRTEVKLDPCPPNGPGRGALLRGAIPSPRVCRGLLGSSCPVPCLLRWHSSSLSLGQERRSFHLVSHLTVALRVLVWGHL